MSISLDWRPEKIENRDIAVLIPTQEGIQLYSTVI